MFSFTSFIITFRESLEAALIVGIVLAYLKHVKATKYNNIVYLGMGAGITVAVILAYVFENYLGGFTGRTEELFEGFIMLTAALLVSFMIFWMKQQKELASKIKQQVDVHVEKNHPWGLFMLTWLSVGREGIETVLFLNAAEFAGGSSPFWSGILGVVVAIILGYIIFTTTKKIPLKHFFNATSMLLIFFAAGLIAHGVHELQEAALIPFIIEELWNINPAVITEGVYPMMHENGTIGSFLKALLGYNGNPSLIEFTSYLMYLIAAGYVFLRPIKTDSKTQ